MGLTPRNPARENVLTDRSTPASGFLGELPAFIETEHLVQPRGFSLRLEDGSRWWIGGSRHAAFIAEKMGGIMALQEGDPEDSRLIYFYDKAADRTNLDLSRLQAQGWIKIYQELCQIYFHPGLRHVLCEYDADREDSFYPLMSFGVHAVHWESLYRGGLPFHGTLLEYQGQGIILAAPGGTGKSTCSRRVPPPWRACCDDEILVVKSPDGRYLAHPFPTWTDYIWKRGDHVWPAEKALPLAGIFFFKQSLEEDRVKSLGGALSALSATRSASEIMILHFLAKSNPGEVLELRQNIFANACEIVQKVPTYRLLVKLTGSFWEHIEAAMGWR